MDTKSEQEFVPTTAEKLTLGDALRYDGQFWQYVGRVIVNQQEMARIGNGPYSRFELDIELGTSVEKVIYIKQ